MSAVLTTDQVDAALAGVRELVQADGGDIVVQDVQGSTATLRLILEGAECRECVMPRQFLETVALDMMQPTLSQLASVVIVDPRET